MMLALIKSFGKNKVRYAHAKSLYEQTRELSRTPEFYREYGVPDTFDGRFEALVLHMYLLWERLLIEGEAGERLHQAIFDEMFVDMNQSLRAIGIGDLGVPKHIKRMMKAYKGRCFSYKHGIDGLHEAGKANLLEEALRRNLFGTCDKTTEQKDIDFFVGYIEKQLNFLKTNTFDDIMAGKIQWLSVAEIKN